MVQHGAAWDTCEAEAEKLSRPTVCPGIVVVHEGSSYAEPWVRAAPVEVQHGLWHAGRSQADAQAAQHFCCAAASVAASSHGRPPCQSVLVSLHLEGSNCHLVLLAGGRTLAQQVLVLLIVDLQHAGLHSKTGSWGMFL